MPHSLLLEGVLAEDAEAARVQVWAFDHATVAGEARRGLSWLAGRASEYLPYIKPLADAFSERISEAAPGDPIRHARDDDLILPIEADHWRAAKLGRILDHFELRFTSMPSDGELLELCLEAEARAVDLLKRTAGPDQVPEGVSPFSGNSITDLSSYVLRRIFEELDASFTGKPETEQERIAADIARRLAELPPELRERIRTEADVQDLSAAALTRTGAIAAVGGALVGTVGIAGFAAYTTLTSAIAAAAGLVGVTPPFAVYVYVTSALAFLSNPVVLGVETLAGGHFAMSHANRQIRDGFVPMMIATAVMAAATGASTPRAAPLVNELTRYFSLLQTADRQLAAQIRNTFPCLSEPG